MRYSSFGFTLVEMVIVVSIFLLFSISSMWVYNQTFERSQASQIATDLQQIKGNWNLFLVDSNNDSPLHSSYGMTHPDASCHNEPAFYDTDLFFDKSGYTNWSGPYTKKEPIDPWGWHYAYNNEGDPYTFDISSPLYNAFYGVNAVLSWCPGQEDVKARYLKIAPAIDKILDNGDGEQAGSFRWDSADNGGLYYLLTQE